ncbi:MAG: hypothetical protein ACTSWY_15730, partial [Promethearchaeota archaeon]
YYRGYILFRLSKIGTENALIKEMMKTKSEDFCITYCTAIYGAWDVIAEVSFKKLEDLDTVVSSIRTNNALGDFIEETTTLVGSKPDYP